MFPAAWPGREAVTGEVTTWLQPLLKANRVLTARQAHREPPLPAPGWSGWGGQPWPRRSCPRGLDAVRGPALASSARGAGGDTCPARRGGLGTNSLRRGGWPSPGGVCLDLEAWPGDPHRVGAQRSLGTVQRSSPRVHPPGSAHGPAWGGEPQTRARRSPAPEGIQSERRVHSVLAPVLGARSACSG